jgi:hypothetical protein
MHRDAGSGTYILDKRLPDGRLKLASGTKDRSTFRAIASMMDVLVARGRFDLIRLVRTRKVSPLEALDAYRRDALDELLRRQHHHRIEDVLIPYARVVQRRSPLSSHGESMERAFRRLVKLAPKGAQVADLPTLLRRVATEGTMAPSHFNHLVNYVRAFLRDAEGVGTRHSLYLDVADLVDLPTGPARLTPAVSPAELDQMAARMEDAQGMTIALAWTGMRPWSEYRPLRWRLDQGVVLVLGTKTASAMRAVPQVVDVERATLAAKAFRKRLAEVSEGRVQAYDLRRFFGRWMAEAGIPKPRRRMYMGHAGGDMTDLYERSEIERYLIDDRARLVAFREAAR